MQIGVETSRAVENKRLFVVDDDEIIRAALQFMLHDENEAHEVPDVAGALSKSEHMKPDVILLGAGLVRKEGIEVLRLLKSRIPGVKLLLVADGDTDPLVSECRQNGADAVLVKPITIEATRKQVDRLLGRITRTVIPIYGV
jgi:DNA-binding response OmpR family regulator